MDQSRIQNQNALRPGKLDFSTRIVINNSSDGAVSQNSKWHMENVRMEFLHDLLPTTISLQLTWQPESYYENTSVNCFTVSPLEGLGNCYKLMANDLRFKMYALNTTCETPVGDIKDLATIFKDEILTIQKHDPHVIVAHGFGTPIAHEIACQLEETQNTVHLIIVSGVVNEFSWDVNYTHAIPTLVPNALDSLIYWVAASADLPIQFVEKSFLGVVQSDFVAMVAAAADTITPFVHPHPDLVSLCQIFLLSSSGVVCLTFSYVNICLQVRSAISHFYAKLIALSNYEPGNVFGGELSVNRFATHIVGNTVTRLQFHCLNLS